MQMIVPLKLLLSHWDICQEDPQLMFRDAGTL